MGLTQVLTLGETMALLVPVQDGELELGTTLTLRFAGPQGSVDLVWVVK